MSRLSTELHKLENAISNDLSTLSIDAKQFLATIEPTLKSDVATALAALMPTAQSLVNNLATTGTITNEQRNSAVSALETTAKSAGLSAAASVLNAAISLAETNIVAAKASSPAAGASSATTATETASVAPAASVA